MQALRFLIALGTATLLSLTLEPIVWRESGSLLQVATVMDTLYMLLCGPVGMAMLLTARPDRAVYVIDGLYRVFCAGMGAVAVIFSLFGVATLYNHIYQSVERQTDSIPLGLLSLFALTLTLLAGATLITFQIRQNQPSA